MHEALVRAVSQRECIYFFVCSTCTSNFFFRHDMGKTNAKSLLFSCKKKYFESMYAEHEIEMLDSEFFDRFTCKKEFPLQIFSMNRN